MVREAETATQIRFVPLFTRDIVVSDTNGPVVRDARQEKLE